METGVAPDNLLESSSVDHEQVLQYTKPVLFVVDSDFESYKEKDKVYGGAELQAMVLAKVLRDKGVKVEFLLPSSDPEYFSDVSHDGFTINRVVYKRVRFLGALFLTGKFAYWMLRNHKRYAVVHVHITNLMATTLGVLKPWLHPKLVTKISGHYEFTGGVLDGGRRFDPKIRLMRWFCRKIDFVHSVSAYTKQVLLERGFKEDQIADIPNAVDLSRFKNRVRQDSNTVTIGYCGRIEAVKGLELLLEAVSRAGKTSPLTLKVSIVGVGDHMPALEKLVTRLALEEQVKFLGRTDQVPEFLDTLDIYCQPSHAEGLPNSVLEAMSDGLPVIASRISGNVDLVEDGITGYLFEKGNVEDLTEKLLALLESSEDRNRMGQRGRNRILAGFSTDAVAKQFIALYYGN